eukprot:TRINITY_DN15089_c0_g1_i1.p1 TRINITY_DN15089_c0_g1~~TRINITY_DN15089_c0_g1_i1.p1  ORF type:complete len:325 (-),score=34.34 TRINITY_DN15089_c0_g1_i1:132-1106(-)
MDSYLFIPDQPTLYVATNVEQFTIFPIIDGSDHLITRFPDLQHGRNPILVKEVKEVKMQLREETILNHPTLPTSSIPFTTSVIKFHPPESIATPPDSPPVHLIKCHRCFWGNCQEAFYTQTALATHFPTHIGNWSQTKKSHYACEWNDCNDVFNTLGSLLKHLRQKSHIGQQPHVPKPIGDSLAPMKKYQCSRCGRTFSDSSNKKKHEKTHNTERIRYACNEPGCNRTYSTPTDLRIHHKSAHLKEQPYICTQPSCKKAFYRPSELYSHERTHDPEMVKLSCGQCGKEFDEVTPFKLHKKRCKTSCKAEPLPSSMMAMKPDGQM